MMTLFSEHYSRDPDTGKVVEENKGLCILDTILDSKDDQLEVFESKNF